MPAFRQSCVLTHVFDWPSASQAILSWLWFMDLDRLLGRFDT